MIIESEDSIIRLKATDQSKIIFFQLNVLMTLMNVDDDANVNF